jgi:hypothetical protein
MFVDLEVPEIGARFLDLAARNAVAVPPKSIIVSAVIQRNPNTAVAATPKKSNNVKTRSNQPTAPAKVTTRNLCAGYLRRPEATRRAFRVPNTKRLKIVANPPYFSNSIDVRCTRLGETNRCIQREPSNFRPPNLNGFSVPWSAHGAVPPQ